MLKSLRRPSAVLLTALLPASLMLSACGGGDEKSYDGFDAVSISGNVGEAPKLEWKGTLKAGDAQTRVVTEGTGEALAKDTEARVNLTVTNGYTHKSAYDAYDPYTYTSLIKIGKTEPESGIDVLAGPILGQLHDGIKVGTRIAATIGSDKLVGPYLGNEQIQQMAATLDIGNEDGMLIVADVVGTAAPHGTEQAAPAWAPKLVEKDGVPTGFTFKGAPSGKLRVAVLVKGDGPVLKKGQTVMPNYLGQVPGTKKPFDGSYGKAIQFMPTLGKGDSIKGFEQALIGQTIGSRIIVEIPPSLGYGAKAQKDDKGKVTIPANSTLYFVIDVIDAIDQKPAPKPALTPSASPTPSGSVSPSVSPSATASR